MGEAKRRKERELPPPGKFEPRVSRREAMRQRALRESEPYTEVSLSDDLEDVLAERKREGDMRAVSVVLFWAVVMLALVLFAAFTIYARTH